MAQHLIRGQVANSAPKRWSVVPPEVTKEGRLAAAERKLAEALRALRLAKPGQAARDAVVSVARARQALTDARHEARPSTSGTII